MKGSHDFSNTTSASGQHNRRQYGHGYKSSIKASPSASRQTMPPHLLRLDSTGEVARNDQMGVRRKSESPLRSDTHHTVPAAKGKNGYSTYGILSSFMQPMPSHIRDMHSRKSYLVPENQTSSVLQGLSALEELHPAKLDSMASYNKMPYAKLANPCRFSYLGEFPQSPECTLINYAKLPPGVFPCHVFKAMHPQRTLATGHHFLPNTVKQQKPFQPSCRSQCTTSMSDSKLTAKSTSSEHSSGYLPGSVSECATRGVGQSKDIAATPDAKQTMEQNGFADERLLGIKLRNSGRCKEASDCCEGNIKTETEDTRNTHCTQMKCMAAETVAGSCEPEKTISCDNLYIPSFLPSPLIPNNDNSKSAISPLMGARPNEDLCAKDDCVAKDDCPKAAYADNDVAKLKKQSAVSTASQVKAASDKVGIEKITMPEKQEVGKLPNEMGKCCAFLSQTFCDDEIEDDDFWSDCDSEVVDSESQREALAYFLTQGNTLTACKSVSRGRKAEWEAEEEYQAQVQEAVSRANTAWTQHYPSIRNHPSLTSKVQFSCGQGVDKFHVYEADPTCVMEYLANQTTDAAERRTKLAGTGEDDEEDVPPDNRFGLRRECGQVLGCLEEDDEDNTFSVVFASSPCSESAAVEEDGEGNEELELSEQEDEESSRDEDDGESSEEAEEESGEEVEEDGECDIEGEDDLVDDGDIDIVFKSE